MNPLGQLLVLATQCIVLCWCLPDICVRVPQSSHTLHTLSLFLSLSLSPLSLSFSKLQRQIKANQFTQQEERKALSEIEGLIKAKDQLK